MKKVILVLGLLAAVAVVSSTTFMSAKKSITWLSAGKDTSCSCKNSFNKIRYGPTVPGDAISTSAQPDFDCFAWSEFVALNWPTNAAAGFGDPMDMSAVQWEGYIQKEALYPAQGAAPAPWNVGNQNLRSYKSSLLSNHIPVNRKVLKFDSKFVGVRMTNSDSISGSAQAFPFNGPSWLGAQNCTNVWYEVLLNKDIYDYVVQHKYYNALNQAGDAARGIPIKFPAGNLNGITGAIELKAAWMEVNNLSNPKWKRYKLSRAVVRDLNTRQFRNVVVALVGLHILHKTASQPTWVWATFEQVDNVPEGGVAPGKIYNFFNPSCKDSSNRPPTYPLKLGGPRPNPINVQRVIPIEAVASGTNTYMQSQIKSIFPNSVWQYYQLVNVVWQNNPGKGVQDTTSRLPFAFTAPAGSHAANTTMETYIQKNTCTTCHTGATIANTSQRKLPGYFADFSFAIGDASYPSQTSIRARQVKVKLKR